MRLLLATVVAVLLTSGSVYAATVSSTYVPGDRYLPAEDRVEVAGDAADDQITVAVGPGGADLADATAPLTVITSGPGNRCAPVDEHRVHCAIVPASSSLKIDGSAGADRLAVVRAPGWTSSFTSLAGGPGDDALTGSDGVEFLDGGPGVDVVRGLGGDDYLIADTVQDGDVLDGGAGTDELMLKGAGLAVDLAAGTVTGPGLTAGLTGVEKARIEAGSTAAGDDGPNILSGGRLLDGRGGDDEIDGGQDDPQVLRGGDGDDTIYYGPGDDVEAGPGDDVVKGLGLSGRAHAVNCGPGEDEVSPVRGDVAGPDCEWVSDDRFRLRNRVRAVAHGTVLRLTASALRPGCGVLAYATQPGVRGALTPVVRLRHRVHVGSSFTVSLPLRATGRRLLARGRLRAPRVVLRRPAHGCPAHGRWTGDPARGLRARLAAG